MQTPKYCVNYCWLVRVSYFIYSWGGGIAKVKVVLWDRDVKAMCSLAKCKQSNLIEHLLYCQPV